MRSRMSGVICSILSASHVEPRFADDRQQALAKVVDGQAANVLGIQPERFGIERLFRSSGRLFEVHDRIRAVDAFQREDLDQFLAGSSLCDHLWATSPAGKGN